MTFHTFMSLCGLLLCLPVFVAKCILETHQHFCFLCFHCRGRFRFSRFLVPSQQRHHRKYFYFHRKYFAKETFVQPPRLCRNFTAGTRRVVSLHLARSGSQSQRGNWIILPSHGASHTIIFVTCINSKPSHMA